MQTSGGTLMDVQTTKRAILREENSSNILVADGEGYMLPSDSALFYSLSGTGSVAGWTNISNDFSSKIGKGSLNSGISYPYTGDGSTLAFTGQGTGYGVVAVGLSVFATIGASVFSWSDADGERKTITSRLVKVGDGVETSFSFYVGTASVRPSTFTLFHTEGGNGKTGTDNGSGVVSGDNIASGTIGYESGLVTITFTNPPDLATDITVSYAVDSYVELERAESLTTADGTTTVFSDKFTAVPTVRPYSCRLSATFSGDVYHFVDNGSGTISEIEGTGKLTSGTVVYATGKIDLEFSVAPDELTGIEITYCQSGLNRMMVTHATGADLELRFDTGFAPANSTGIAVVAEKIAKTEFSGNGVLSGILLLAESGKKCGFRTSRSFIGSTSEDETGTKATLRVTDGGLLSISFYGKVGSGTGKCYIRAWGGATPATQVALTSGKYHFSSLTGDTTLVTDPANGSMTCVQCNVTTTLTRFGASIRIPSGAKCLSIEWEGGEAATYFGERIMWVSGILVNAGSALVAYAPAFSSRSLPVPSGTAEAGKLVASDGLGGTLWIDAPTSGGGGGGGIASLNGLTGTVQNFATGSAGTAPTFSSAGSTHTLHLPLATASTNVTAGLVSNETLDFITSPLFSTNGANVNQPTFTADSNFQMTLTIPFASRDSNVTAGLLSYAEYSAISGSAIATEVTASTNITMSNGQRKIMTAVGEKYVTLPTPTETGQSVILLNATASEATIVCPANYTFIDGSSTGIITSEGECWVLVSDTTNNKWLLS